MVIPPFPDKQLGKWSGPRPQWTDHRRSVEKETDVPGRLKPLPINSHDISSVLRNAIPHNGHPQYQPQKEEPAFKFQQFHLPGDGGNRHRKSPDRIPSRPHTRESVRTTPSMRYERESRASRVSESPSMTTIPNNSRAATPATGARPTHRSLLSEKSSATNTNTTAANLGDGWGLAPKEPASGWYLVSDDGAVAMNDEVQQFMDHRREVEALAKYMRARIGDLDLIERRSIGERNSFRFAIFMELWGKLERLLGPYGDIAKRMKKECLLFSCMDYYFHDNREYYDFIPYFSEFFGYKQMLKQSEIDKQQYSEKIDELRVVVNSCQTEMTNLGNEINAHKETIKNKDEDIERAHREIREKDRLIQGLERGLDDTKNDYMDLKANTAAGMEAKDLMTLQLSRLKRTIEQMTEENDRLNLEYIKKIELQQDLDMMQQKMQDSDAVASQKEKDLKDKISSWESRYQDLSHEHSKEMKARTPRPDWEWLQDQKQEGMSSIELAELARDNVAEQFYKYQETLYELQMLDPKKLEKIRKKDTKFFPPTGTSPDIPKFLRSTCRIRNKNLSKRDCEKQIKEFWRDMESEGKVGREGFQEFFYNYLLRKYGQHNLAIEYATNLLDACKRYDDDADCELFLAVCYGRVTQDVWWDQVKMIQTIQEQWLSVDMQTNDGKATSRISFEQFTDVITEMFPVKTRSNIRKLKQAILEEQPNCQLAGVVYNKLFAEDKDGNQGPFAEELRDQHMSERGGFLDEIKQSIALVTKPDGTISSLQVRVALEKVEPGITEERVAEIAAIGFGFSNPSQMQWTAHLVTKAARFIDNINGEVITRSIRPDDDEDDDDELEVPVSISNAGSRTNTTGAAQGAGSRSRTPNPK